MESWDDENFEPKVVTPVPVVPNKWEGEDEDDEVKESWEDEDEEPKIEEIEAAPKPKKKTLQDKIADKEKLKREEYEKRLKEDQEEDILPEEKAKRELESDIKFALETTFDGSNSSSTVTGLEAVSPNNKDEFQQLAETISTKLQPLTKNSEYPNFAEDLIRNICVTLSSAELKKIKTTLDNLYLEKQKIEKGEKAKKSKGKGKAKLKLDNENQYSAYVDEFDDFNDFM